jgi:2-polyprenyl-3-methyl-5-hydroxy-6-metoxy-1,4-benzoquinol methylase
MKIKSPVTDSYNTSKIKDIPTAAIIDLYKAELNFDISEYFHGLDHIELLRCDDTGYRFYYPFDIFGDDKFYQHLQNHENYYPGEKWEYVAARKLIGENKHVLEIGSGGAQFLESLKSQHSASLCGLELNTRAVEDAKAKGLNLIAETIDVFSKKNKERFDVVCGLQVLEHIYDVRSYIQSSLEVLKKGGQLIICVPNNNPYIYKQDSMHTLNLPPHHAGLWNRKAFSSLLSFFPMRLNKVLIEPLHDYKFWYQTQVRHLREIRSPWAGVLSIIPRPIYKAPLIALRNIIEGRNIMVEFIKS